MRYLMILEVSQKQAYIFSSVKLKDNITHSSDIEQVTDPGYFSSIAKKEGVVFSKSDNLVYSGGGHTVLEFDSETAAKKFAYAVSKTVKMEFPQIELFIKTISYDEEKTPGENLKRLSDALEAKKSIRAASFHQGSFGVERVNSSARKVQGQVELKNRIVWEGEKEYIPEGYHTVRQFDDLGNEKHTSSFIAVVHIDGNSMGKRVEGIRKKNEGKSWTEYKQVLNKFSHGVDEDFKSAFREMMDRIAANLTGKAGEELNLKENYFPVRKIILAGDDVCFVTEGRIGLEAARIFIEQLSSKINKADKKGYTACAGVVVVHQKYPFYKAYELAELLCSNAKRLVASYQENGEASAVDWHIEFGELADSVEELRQSYITSDGNHLELRPYLISAEKGIWEKEKIRRYEIFRKLITALQREEIAYARGKIKGLREPLKAGEETARYYLKTNLIHELAMVGYEGIYREVEVDRLFTGKGLDREIFIDTCDKKKCSLYFDAIEMIDTFIGLD